MTHSLNCNSPPAATYGVLIGCDGTRPRRYERLREGTWLGQEIGGEERVLKPMSAQDDFVASRKVIDAVKDLIPGIVRHQANERIQTDDGLLIEMVKNSCGEGIGRRRLQLNILI